MAQNANAKRNSKTPADGIRPPDVRLPVASQLDQIPVSQFSDRGLLGLESVNQSNFADTRNPQLMFNLRYDDSHQMLLDKLDAAADITNRLERLELEVVDIRRGLDALDDTVEITTDRIEALEHGISHLRRQAFATEESLQIMVSGFDNLENEVIKMGHQLSNNVESQPPDKPGERCRSHKC